MALVFFGLLSSMALCAVAELLSSIAGVDFFCLETGETVMARLVFFGLLSSMAARLPS